MTESESDTPSYEDIRGDLRRANDCWAETTRLALEWRTRARNAETELSAIDAVCPRVRSMTIIDAIKADQDDASRLHDEKMNEREKRRAAEAALRAIIARADNNEPGTSKVQDMKRIAEVALNEK